HTRSKRDWSSDVCSSDLGKIGRGKARTCQAQGYGRTEQGARTTSRGHEDSFVVSFQGVGGQCVGFGRPMAVGQMQPILARLPAEIGRASCRESVWVSGTS